MRISLCTDCLGQLPFEPMLDKVAEMGVYGVEMTVGGWSPAPHLRADELVWGIHASEAGRVTLPEPLFPRLDTDNEAVETGEARSSVG